MDRISISNLFPSNQDFKPLDVYSLYNTNERKTRNKINININRLVNLREERKKKILKEYDKIFNICLNKINLANELNKTEFIYEVPEGVFGYYDYNTLDCLKYIEDKLRKNIHVDTVILNNKSIYVSWLNIKDNMKDAKHSR